MPRLSREEQQKNFEEATKEAIKALDKAGEDWKVWKAEQERKKAQTK